MSEPLFTRCPMCSGTLSLPAPATLNTGGTTTDCPCRRSKTPGWCEVGLTLGQVDGLVDRRAENDALREWEATLRRYLGMSDGDRGPSVGSLPDRTLPEVLAENDALRRQAAACRRAAGGGTGDE